MRSYQSKRVEQASGSQRSLDYVTPQGICDQEQAKVIAKKLFELYDRDRNGVIDGNERKAGCYLVSPMLIDAYKGMSKAFNPTQVRAKV